MEVLLEKSSPTTAQLTVKLVKDDYQQKVNQSIKNYSKKANIKGFRPGKVPTHVISRMYGKGILADEINHMISHAVNDYIKENKIPLVGDPLPDREKADAIDWDKQSDFEFTFDLGLAGEFEVDLAKLDNLVKYSIQPGENDLDKTIEDLRQRFAETIHPEKSEENDIVYGELSQESSEFSTKTAVPVHRVKEDVREKFIGIQKEDKISLDIQSTFEDETALSHVTGWKKEDVSNLAGEFEFIVEDITRSVPATLNDEFFHKVLGYAEEITSEEQFREKLAEIVKENHDRETDALYKRDVEDKLLEKTPIDLPEEFLKKWLLHTNEGKLTAEEIDGEYDAFAKALRLSLINNRIAETNEIKVEVEDLLDEARNLIKSQFGIYGDDEGMKETIDRIAQQYLADRERDNYRKVFQKVFDQKIFEIISGSVTPEEKTISVDEFEELLKIEETE